jgi:hypothetical protein
LYSCDEGCGLTIMMEISLTDEEPYPWREGKGIDDMSNVESLREYLRNFEKGRDSDLADRSDDELSAAITQAKEWIGGRRWSWHTVARNILRDGRPHA